MKFIIKTTYQMTWMLCLLMVTPVFAFKTVSIEGYGQSQQEAVQSCLKTAVGQVAGLYLSSETQVKNAILVKHEVIEKTSGFIKSYKILSCTKTDNYYKCRLKVTVETSKKKIIRLLKKYMGKKTCHVNIDEYIQGKLNPTKVIEPVLMQELIKKGYFVVTQEIDPNYRLEGQIHINRVPSQLNTPTFYMARLETIQIRFLDRANTLNVLSSLDTQKCSGSGNTMHSAGIEFLKCLSKQLLGKTGI